MCRNIITPLPIPKIIFGHGFENNEIVRQIDRGGRPVRNPYIFNNCLMIFDKGGVVTI